MQAGTATESTNGPADRWIHVDTLCNLPFALTCGRLLPARKAPPGVGRRRGSAASRCCTTAVLFSARFIAPAQQEQRARPSSLFAPSPEALHSRATEASARAVPSVAPADGS